jgi:hypothetical protein
VLAILNHRILCAYTLFFDSAPPGFPYTYSLKKVPSSLGSLHLVKGSTDPDAIGIVCTQEPFEFEDTLPIENIKLIEAPSVVVRIDKGKATAAFLGYDPVEVFIEDLDNEEGRRITEITPQHL